MQMSISLQRGLLARDLLGTGAARSKAVRGDHLEHQVWSDVETFLRNPEPLLQ